MEKITVVGIDPGVAESAVVVLAEEEVNYRHITTDPKKFDHKLARYEYIVKEVLSFVRLHIQGSQYFQDAYVFIEDYAYGVQGKISMLATMGEIGGILRMALWKKTGRVPADISPGQWKKFLCGSGNMKKDDFKMQVYKKHGLDLKTVDLCAAYGIADLGWHILGLPERRKLCKYELAVLKTIDKRK